MAFAKLVTKQRAHGPVMIAIAIHLVVASAFLQVLITPSYLDWIFTARAEPDVPTEQIRYVIVAPEDASRPVAAPQAETTQPLVLRAPMEAPATVHTGAMNADTIPAQPTRIAGRGTATDPSAPGGVVLVPASADPRIWNVRSAHVAGEGSRAEALEGTLARAIRGSNDSIDALGVQTVRPEWVVGRGGSKLGLDNSRIYLGKVSVPAVMLGLLPIHGFGCMPTMYFPDRPVRDSVGIACIQLENPGLAERAERIDEMSAEIRARATLAVDGRDEISRIAARKDRERAARLQAQQSMNRGASTRPPGR